MPTDITIAFAGHAANAKANVQALVADFLSLGSPDGEGYYEKPDRWGKIAFYVLAPDKTVPDGLKHALNLALSIEDSKVYLVTSEDGDESYDEYVDKAFRFADPLAEIIDILSDAPRPYLLMNWDEQDADDEHLINLAHQQGHIKVSDLVMGLTAIVPDTDGGEEEEDAPEPEPEPEERPSRRRTRKEEPEELDEKQEELEEEPSRPAKDEKPEPKKAEEPQASTTSTLEEEISAAHRATTQSTIAVGDITVSTDLLREVLAVLGQAEFYMQAIDSANAVKNLADGVKPSPLTIELEKQASRLTAVLNPEEPYEKAVAATAEKPKKKPTGKTTRVIWDEDAGEWKKAGRGRPRAGARTGVMDEDGTVTEE